MKVDGSDLRCLTNNATCDYQPRRGAKNKPGNDGVLTHLDVVKFTAHSLTFLPSAGSFVQKKLLEKNIWVSCPICLALLCLKSARLN